MRPGPSMSPGTTSIRRRQDRPTIACQPDFLRALPVIAGIHLRQQPANPCVSILQNVDKFTLGHIKILFRSLRHPHTSPQRNQQHSQPQHRFPSQSPHHTHSPTGHSGLKTQSIATFRTSFRRNASPAPHDRDARTVPSLFRPPPPRARLCTGTKGPLNHTR